LEISPREREVLDLVGQRLTNAEIGARLYISVRTVESHVSSLLRRTGAADRRELADLAADGIAADGDDEIGLVPDLVGSPLPISSFVGRSAVVDEVEAALGTSRLVTVIGPGGIGKTRVAIEVAARRRGDRAWFVDLVPARSGMVASAIAAVVGAMERPNQALLDVVVEQLGGADVLMVLDNCEHVLDDTADVVARLTAAAGRLTVLATSREPLGIAGEQVVTLAPLEVGGSGSAASRLFRERAVTAGAPEESLDDDLVDEIVERLDGLPLAIELAAARTTSLGLDGVAAAIDDRMRFLVGARGADERHRSLRAVLDWSHGLLEEDERMVLRRAAVFTGGFTHSDVAAVADVGDIEALDVLGRLTSKSLLVRTSGPGGSLYRMLDTVRDYASEQLDVREEREAASAGLLRHSIAEAEVLEAATRRDGGVPASSDRLIEQFRAAAAWGATNDPGPTHHLSRLAGFVSYGNRMFGESEAWYERAAALAPDDLARARGLYDAADASLAMMRGPVGYRRYLDAADAAERGGDPAFAARALCAAIELVERRPATFAMAPEPEEGYELLARAVALDPEPDAVGRAHLAMARAWLAGRESMEVTIAAAEEARVAAEAIDDPVLESDAMDLLSCSLATEGQLLRSVEIVNARLELVERMPVLDPHTGCEILDIIHMACDAPLDIGDIRRALEVAERAIHDPLTAGALHILHRELVTALALSGRFDDAIAHAVTMRTAWERANRPTSGWMAPATSMAALAFGLRGDDAGRKEWEQLTEEVGPHGTVLAEFAAIRLALHDGRLDDALTFSEEAVERLAAVPGRRSAVMANNYGGYAWLAIAETLSLRHEPDAEERIAAMSTGFVEHRWREPTMQRIEGRLRGDPGLIVEAALGFASLGAEFEEAATRALLAGREGDVGRRWLDAAGCEPPAAAGTIR
jgi:predicted ATPase/DNA-binding CsgD family transcriptional regulator